MKSVGERIESDEKVSKSAEKSVRKGEKQKKDWEVKRAAKGIRGVDQIVRSVNVEKLSQ